MRSTVGTLDAVRPAMATHFREATERCKSHAGVTMPSFRCVRCKCTKLIKGRKTVVQGTGKFGWGQLLDIEMPLMNGIEALKKMLPSVTMDYLSSEKGRTVAEKLIHEHNEN